MSCPRFCTRVQRGKIPYWLGCGDLAASVVGKDALSLAGGLRRAYGKWYLRIKDAEHISRLPQRCDDVLGVVCAVVFSWLCGVCWAASSPGISISSSVNGTEYLDCLTPVNTVSIPLEVMLCCTLVII